MHQTPLLSVCVSHGFKFNSLSLEHSAQFIVVSGRLRRPQSDDPIFSGGSKAGIHHIKFDPERLQQGSDYARLELLTFVLCFTSQGSLTSAHNVYHEFSVIALFQHLNAGSKS